MDTLPLELLRYLIPFLPLTSLIAARGVSVEWRSLALTASLHPARKTLLDLYLAAIVHPNFPSIVEKLQPHVHEFDREAYISNLTSRGCVLPDLFELWILEWPSTAVHFWAWPGLESGLEVEHDYYHEMDGNALANSSSTIDTIPLPKKDVAIVGQETCRVLALFNIHLYDSLGMCWLWLVVDANERINDRRTGRLLWTIALCDGVHADEQCTFGPKKIFHDPPFGPSTDVKLIEFLDMLDVSCDQIDEVLGRYYFTGVQQIEDGE